MKITDLTTNEVEYLESFENKDKTYYEMHLMYTPLLVFGQNGLEVEIFIGDLTRLFIVIMTTQGMLGK